MITPAIRYASLYFIAGVDNDTNELITLEIIHRYVELLDKYFGNVCELDLIFNFNKVRTFIIGYLAVKYAQAYYVLDELLLAGELQEPSRKSLLRVIAQQDALAEGEDVMDNLRQTGFH